MELLRWKVTLPLLLLTSSFLILSYSDEIKIKAQKFAKQSNNTVVYTGNVILTYGNRTLTCQKLIVEFFNGTRVGNVTAIDNVTYRDTKITVVSKKAIYNAINKTITFIGNVLVTTPDAVSQGDKLIYFLTNETYELSGTQSVKTVINLNKLKTPKNGTEKVEQNNFTGKR